MSEKLFEADFLTVNLRSAVNNQVDTGTEMPNNNASAAQQETANSAEVIDWKKELNRRLDANNAKSSDAKQSAFEIESKFFKEFFSANWDEESAKQLMLLGEPLKKVFKVLGFDPMRNPIYKFLTLTYVKDELLKTKLLNVNTFKAIYNAVAQKLIADSEFFTYNKYNIIYCKDLYKRSPEEMLEYLKLQNEIIPRTEKKYTLDMQEKNRRVFIDAMLAEKNPIRRAEILSTDAARQDKKIKLQAMKSAKLNSIDMAEAIKTHWTNSGSGSRDKSHLSSKGQANLASKINTPAQILAAIQFLSMTTDSTEAKKALSNERLGSVSTKNLVKATSAIAEIMPKGALQKSDADALVGILLSKL